jgi:hypothetical protein
MSERDISVRKWRLALMLIQAAFIVALVYRMKP